MTPFCKWGNYNGPSSQCKDLGWEPLNSTSYVTNAQARKGRHGRTSNLNCGKTWGLEGSRGEERGVERSGLEGNWKGFGGGGPWWGEGSTHTFLEHPVDREAEHHFLRETNLVTQLPLNIFPTMCFLSRPPAQHQGRSTCSPSENTCPPRRSWSHAEFWATHRGYAQCHVLCVSSSGHAGLWGRGRKQRSCLPCHGPYDWPPYHPFWPSLPTTHSLGSLSIFIFLLSKK